MLILPILVLPLLLATGIKSEEINCRWQDQLKIMRCARAALKSAYGDSSHQTQKEHSCEYLEMTINCAEAKAQDCTKYAGYVGYPSWLRGDTNESCYHEIFDDYFNKDGMCSFQDVKDIYECVLELEEDRSLFSEDNLCRLVQQSEVCIRATHQTCMGFFQNQISINIQMIFIQRGTDVPQCMEAYIKN